MDQILQRKVELLELQKEKSDKFNKLLTEHGGLNEVSRLTCKNLEAAVAASKKPGFIHYYQVPEEAKKLVKDGELKKLQQQITKIQKELDQVNNEILAKEMALKTKEEPTGSSAQGVSVSNIKQWFSTYGQPKPMPVEYYSSFSPNAKVYGGTNHYSAFKTQTKNMKRGRLTR